MAPRLWRSLETLRTPAAVLAEWRMLTGDEFGRAQAYLRPTNRLAQTYPCTHNTGCGERHEIEDLEDGVSFRAVSRSEVFNCRSIPLQPHELVVHELDTAKLCESVRSAFGFDATSTAISREHVRSHPVGVRGAARSPVFLCIVPSEDWLLREVEALLALVAGPFILLTPSHAHCTPRVEGVLRRNFCASAPLSSALALGERGKLSVVASIDGVLEDFDRRLAERGAALVKTVEGIRHDIQAVAKASYELRRENEELRQLQADGVFKFALKVDGADFHSFAVIMALGNRKTAADHLRIPHRTFYDRVDKWSLMGREHRQMSRMVEWRKRTSRKLKVRLDLSMMFGEPGDLGENPATLKATVDVLKDQAADGRSQADVLAEILQALQNQNAKNWPAVRQELIDILKEELPQ